MNDASGFDVGAHEDINIQVNCTWGEGPDVALDISANLDRLENIHPRGFVPVDLTADEAVELGTMLIEAGEEAKRLLITQSDFI